MQCHPSGTPALVWKLNVETGNSAESSLASQPAVQSEKPCLKTMWQGKTHPSSQKVVPRPSHVRSSMDSKCSGMHKWTHTRKKSVKDKIKTIGEPEVYVVAEYGLNMYSILSSISSIRPPDKTLNEGAESGSTLLQPQLLEAELPREHEVSCTHEDDVSTTVGNVMQTKHQVSHPGC